MKGKTAGHKGGIASVKHEHHGQASRDTDNGHHGAGVDHSPNHDNREIPPGIDYSINPGVPVPETVLVAVMTDGSYLLMAYPQREPAAFVTAEDADSLQREFQDAFGNSADQVTCENQSSALPSCTEDH